MAPEAPRAGGIVIRKALAAGLGVVALVRRPGAITESHPALSVVGGSPLKASDLLTAMAGCDGVISALNNNRASDMPWARPVSPPGFMTDSIRNVLKVMETFQARRIVVMSAAGAGEPLADVPAPMRWLISPWHTCSLAGRRHSPCAVRRARQDAGRRRQFSIRSQTNH